MRANVRRYKSFIRHLMSYIILSLLPLSLMGGLVYFYFINILKQDVLNSDLNKLDRAKNAIDSQIKQMNVISTQINIRNVPNFMFEDEPLKAMDIIAELHNFVFTSNFFSEMLLYYRGDSYIYSSSSSFEVSFMMRNMYHYEQWDEASFKTTLNQLEGPEVRSTEPIVVNGIVQPYVTFLYPLKVGFITNRTLLFLVPESSLRVFLADVTKEYLGNTIIMDDKGKIISSLRDDPYLHSEEFQRYAAQSVDSLHQSIQLNGSSYLFTYVKSQETGWKYISLIPAQQITQRIKTYKLVLLYFTGFLLILICIGIYVMMSLNYKPLYRLKLYAESLRKTPAARGDELDDVLTTLEYLNDQNDNLKQSLEYHSQAAKDYFLFQLLKGAYLTQDEILDKSRNVEIDLVDKVYRIVILQFSQELKHRDAHEEHVMQSIAGLFQEPFQAYGRDQLEVGRVIFLITYSEEESGNSLNQLIQIKQQAETLLRISMTWGVGNAYTDVTLIPKSYIEAMAAIDYRLLKGTGQLIRFEEFTSQSSELIHYPQFKKESLRLLIKQGDTAKIDSMLSEIISTLKQDNPSIAVARLLCYEILSTVFQTLREVKALPAGTKLEIPDVFALLEFESIDNLAAIVLTLSEKIHAYLTSMEKQNELNLIEQIMQMIQTHYPSPDFSVQALAEHFQMTQPKISQYFKDRIGKNLLDYITELRMERAKGLLKSSKLPIQDIALDVGYVNVTSFIRRFKQVELISPGEYRRQLDQDA